MKPKVNTGYASLFLLFIAVIFLVWSGYYVWRKYAAPRLPDGATTDSRRDPLSYLSGIKSQISEVQKKQEVKNRRALELAENTKRVTDKSSLYSLEIPESWEIISDEGASGTQVSYLSAQSSYFSTQETAGKKYYDAGAKFSVSVLAGENENVLEGNGGHANLIGTRKDNREGGDYVYHIFQDPDSENGQVIDAHIIHGGSTYLFMIIYNPQTFTDAEYTFKEIIYSVEFR